MRKVNSATGPARAIALLFCALLVLGAGQGAWAQEVPRGVSYVTLRDTTGASTPSLYYGEGRGTLSAGRCVIGQRDLGFLAPAAEAVPFRIPEEILSVERIEVTSPASELAALAARTGEAAPLLYVHGFYIDFEKGCRRATVFKENAGQGENFLWFSWPSDGEFLNYARDEVDLAWSVPDLADVVAGMVRQFGRGRVNLAGHSLGARGVMLALYDLAGQAPDLRLGEVVLLAPDIDFGVFAKLLPRIRPMARRITIYVGEGDRPLALSAQLHGYPRLGQSGNPVETLAGVEVIDTGDLPVRSASGHLYHLYNPEVGRDLAHLLNEGRGAAARDNLVAAGPNLWRLQPGE